MEMIKKAYEIKDARIKFVSLVDKAANKKAFLIKKEDGTEAGFSTYGRIVKADSDNHYVTGIVYEPMVEDSQGNYMTAEEIAKAAYWFAKNGNRVDLQHSFKPLDGAQVVESWIAKADFSIGQEDVKEGTWLMTVEIEDEAIWKAVERGDITGFSMGGIGYYSEEDVNLNETNVTKAGRKLSCKNADSLRAIYDQLGKFITELEGPNPNPAAQEQVENALDKLEDEAKKAGQCAPAPVQQEAQPKEDEEVKPSPGQEVEEKTPASEPAPTEAQQPEDGEKKKQPFNVSKGIDAQRISQMVEKAVSEAVQPLQELNAEQIQAMIEDAVANAIEPLMQSRGISKQLDNVQKSNASEHHYLEGIL